MIPAIGFHLDKRSNIVEQIIQLQHPAGKKAVRFEKRKYDILRAPILNRLRTKGESTHSEILQAINEDLDKNKISFDGSVEWHMEWVKLDLEARNEIKRDGSKSPIKFALV
jgi:hypothetical protein